MAKDADSKRLSELRQQIDEIDATLVKLISERARAAQDVGSSKGFSKPVDFYRPEREAQVLRRVKELNAGPMSDEELLRLFKEIISSCLAQQEPLRVGYLGPEGTFTQSAVTKRFGQSVRGLPMGTIEEVFQEVESGSADFGVVPIENSTEGTVNHTLDRFLSSPLKICGEVELRIHQNLMGAMKDIKSVKRICSHPQSLAQCRGWLSEFFPNVEQIPVASNAEAARRARDEAGTAAIAGQSASEVYGLNTLYANIEDQGDNTTRFLVIGRKLFPPSGNDKTSLLLSASGTEGPGVLYRLLDPLARHEVSMNRIESRPSRRRKWDYVFFVDIEGHAEDDHVAKALAEVEANATLFRVLGAYPVAVD